MGKKTTVAVVLTITVLSLAGIGYLVYYLSAKQPDSQARVQGEQSQSTQEQITGDTVDMVPLQLSQSAGIPLNPNSSDSSSTQQNKSKVNADGTISLGQQQTRSKRLPGPESFGDYDQYVSAPSTLFADSLVGKGKEAVGGAKVAVAYKGWLTNGQLFDQSEPDKPFVFTLGQPGVILGWHEGIAGMKAGGKRRLVVPPQAGYGEQGRDPIPPNAVMVFDVELLAVE